MILMPIRLRLAVFGNQFVIFSGVADLRRARLNGFGLHTHRRASIHPLPGDDLHCEARRVTPGSFAACETIRRATQPRDSDCVACAPLHILYTCSRFEWHPSSSDAAETMCTIQKAEPPSAQRGIATAQGTAP